MHRAFSKMHSSNDQLPRPARVQIAPMLAVTDRHFRYFIRGLTTRAELWTEMQVDGVLLHTQNVEAFLDYDEKEHPIVCQIGGCDPERMAEAAHLVSRWGYDEVNINVGCPSLRVAGQGCFGAALMKSPETVRSLIYSIKRKVPNMKLSVKTRVGVDEWDTQGFLNNFISSVSSAGCERFIIHARKAWLKGLNPTKNRTVPPLQYERVYRLVKDFPNLSFSINGGIETLDDIDALLHARWRPKSILTPRKYPPKIQRRIVGQSDDQQQRTSADRLDVANHTTTEQIIKESSDIDTNWDIPCDLVEEIAANNELKSKRSRQIIKEKTDQIIVPVPMKSIHKDTLEDFYPLMNSLQSDIPVIEGAMIGRAAIKTPSILSSVDSRFYGVSDPITAKTPRTILQHYIDYLDRHFIDPRSHKSSFPLIKPILGVLQGRPGSNSFRYKLDEAIRLHSKSLKPGDLIQYVIDYLDDAFPKTLDTMTDAAIIY